MVRDKPSSSDTVGLHPANSAARRLSQTRRSTRRRRPHLRLLGHDGCVGMTGQCQYALRQLAYADLGSRPHVRHPSHAGVGGGDGKKTTDRGIGHKGVDRGWDGGCRVVISSAPLKAWVIMVGITAREDCCGP